MASKFVLNHENLNALGSARLADLLLEVSTGDAATKRRLRLELAAVESPRRLASDIRKRLVALRDAKTIIGWRGLKGLVAELSGLQGLIATSVAQFDAGEAVELLLLFLGMADGILERISDTGNVALTLFQQASNELASIAERVSLGDREPFLKDLVETILSNSYGQTDGLITRLGPWLGTQGLHDLQRALLSSAAKPAKPSSAPARRTGRWRRGQRLERDVALRRPRADIIHRARIEIADALGDVDAYIALQSRHSDAETLAEIASRLLKAGRLEDVLATINKYHAKRPSARLTSIKADTLDALGQPAEAQSCRLEGYHNTLDANLLRQYLKRLPDFDDIEAEDAALDFAAHSADGDRALELLIKWPSLDRAASFVLSRASSITLNDEDLLLLAIGKLAPRYPLAAVVLLRKLVNGVLMNHRTQDYGRAAEYLSESEHLSQRIEDFGGIETHKAYLARLHANFRHRNEFWQLAA